jgi:alpha-mannosidase
MGLHRFSYALVPHFGPYHHAGIVQSAYAFNSPVRSRRLVPRTGQPGTLPSLMQCDDRNIIIEAVKKAEDSNDLIVRLYECHNNRGNAELVSARRPIGAALCDLEETEIADLELSDGMVRFDYKPFEILTIKLKY